MSAIEIVRRRGTHGGYRTSGSRVQPSFSGSQLSPAASVANLPAALTINGVTVYPTLLYRGGDASAAGWAPVGGYGETLAYGGSGTAPSFNIGSPLLGSSDDGIGFVGSARTFSGSVTLGNIGTRDQVLEAIVELSASAIAIEKEQAGSPYLGWRFYCGNVSKFSARYYSAGTDLVPAAAAGSAGAIYHAMCFLDRSGSAQWYVNGLASGAAVDISALVSTTLDGSVAFTMPQGAAPLSSGMHYLAMWTGASWLDTHLQPTLAAARFALVEGLVASLARGANAPTAARPSVAYLNKSGRLWSVGANWIRAEPEGTLGSDAGTNVCLQSEVLATTWALIATATRAANSAVAPDGNTTADTLTAVADADGITQAFASITAVARVYSHFVMRNGAADVPCTLRIVKTSDSSVIATRSFTATATWQRVEDITGTCVLNDTSIQILITTAGGSLFVWGGQFELGAVSSSYIPTTTAAVTRAADSLFFPATGNVGEGQGALLIDFYVPRAFTNDRNRFLGSVSIGASTANAVSLFVDTSGYVNGSTAITSGDAGAVQVATSVLAAAGSHRALLSWRHNELRLWVDGVQATPDTACDIPASMTRLNIFSDGVLANQAGPIRIVRWKDYDKFLSSYSKAG